MGLKAKDGIVALGLQDSYALLDDPLGEEFRSAALDSKESPLVAGTRSILAHGFDRFSESVFDSCGPRRSLAGVEEAGLAILRNARRERGALNMTITSHGRVDEPDLTSVPRLGRSLPPGHSFDGGNA
jgi:hypothetical protein